MSRSVRIPKRVRVANKRMVAILGHRTEQIGQTDIPPGHAGATLYATGEGDRTRAERSFDNYK